MYVVTVDCLDGSLGVREENDVGLYLEVCEGPGTRHVNGEEFALEDRRHGPQMEAVPVHFGSFVV